MQGCSPVHNARTQPALCILSVTDSVSTSHRLRAQTSLRSFWSCKTSKTSQSSSKDVHGRPRPALSAFVTYLLLACSLVVTAQLGWTCCEPRIFYQRTFAAQGVNPAWESPLITCEVAFRSSAWDFCSLQTVHRLDWTYKTSCNLSQNICQLAASLAAAATFLIA